MAGALLGNLFPLIATLALLVWSIVLLSRSSLTPQSASEPLLNQAPASLGLQLTGAALFAGFSAAAILEVTKRLAGLRGIYQRRQIKLWLNERSPRVNDEPRPDQQESRLAQLELERLAGILTGAEFKALSAEPLSYRRHSLAFRRRFDGLSRYSTSRRIARFYDLPIERLAAQLYAAMDVAAQEPERYFELMTAVTGMHLPELYKGSERAETEIAQAIRAGVDSMHTDVGEGWKNYVRGTAIWLSGAVGFIIVQLTGVESRAAGMYVLSALVLGGFFSWSVRDAAATIERWRR
ncbi:hypothetical protein ACI780_24165 [Geodermatophilus sp. SYSU D00814]